LVGSNGRAVALVALHCVACDNGAGAFLSTRLPNLCAGAYATCDVTVGCALDSQHYVRGRFPGARRVVVSHPEPTAFRVLLYLEETVSSGTELSIRLHEPDCTFDPDRAGVVLEGVDIIERAGLDRTLVFEGLAVDQPGEHLLEVFSDATVSYLLIAEPMESEVSE